MRSFIRRLRSSVGKYLFAKCGKNINIEKGADFGKGDNIQIGDNSGLGVNCYIRGGGNNRKRCYDGTRCYDIAWRPRNVTQGYTYEIARRF